MSDDEILALLATHSPEDWPRGILATADIAEAEANAEAALRKDDPYWASDERSQFERRWTPPHALAAVRHWRGVVERHGRGYGKWDWCATCCDGDGPYGAGKFPCPDLTETADEARAYISGGTP